MYRLIFIFTFFFLIVFNALVNGQDIYSHSPSGHSINDCINRNRIVKNKVLKCIETEYEYNESLISMSVIAKNVYEYGEDNFGQRKGISIA
jgi:hypothetical protein